MNESEQIHEHRRHASLRRRAAARARVPGVASVLLAAAVLAGARPSVARAGESAATGGMAAPAVQAGLAGRWAAAHEAARRNGWGTYWVGWAVRVPAGTEVASSNGPHAGDPPQPVRELVGEDGAALRLGVEPASTDAVFFFRMDGRSGTPREMRIRRPDAPLGVAGVPVAWLGVAPDAESLGLLERVLGSAPEAVRREIGPAAALHRDPAAVAAFVRRLLANETSAAVRAQAAYWLRYQPTDESLALLEEIVRRDASPEVRDEAVTAIAQRGTGAARRVLRRLSADPGVPAAARREAGEWLARGGGGR
ncbi:MAG TPA: HEAT repeat domain-containing protein [Longimicrobium sp.]|nr:HEAT repeat domain-containing protein [Longimicrobium sp.]